MIILCSLLICKTEVAMLFLTFASEMISMMLWLLNELLTIFSSLLQWAVLTLVFLWFTVWKKKQSGTVSIGWNSRESSLFKLLKASKTWLRWLLVSTIRLLTLKHYLEIRQLMTDTKNILTQ